MPFVPLQLLAMVEMSSPVSRTITECLRLYSSPGEKREPQPNVEMEQSVSAALKTFRIEGVSELPLSCEETQSKISNIHLKLRL